MYTEHLAIIILGAMKTQESFPRWLSFHFLIPYFTFPTLALRSFDASLLVGGSL